jgi:NAD(P)H-nitrite reductase large subunit
MNTREIVLVGAGVVVGYFLVTYLKKSKDNAQLTIASTEPTVDQAKIDDCNKEVSTLLQGAKFASAEAQEKFKKQAFEACMAKKA